MKDRKGVETLLFASGLSYAVPPSIAQSSMMDKNGYFQMERANQVRIFVALVCYVNKGEEWLVGVGMQQVMKDQCVFHSKKQTIPY